MFDFIDSSIDVHDLPNVLEARKIRKLVPKHDVSLRVFPGKGAGPGFSLSVGPLALPPDACREASADLFLGFLDFLEN